MSAGGRNAVVFATDGHLFPAAMFAARRVAAFNDRADTDVIVFCSSPMDEARARISRLPFSVYPLVFPPGIDLPPTYYRLFAPVALASGYRRIVYLDVDTYAHRPSVFRLFDLDMAGMAVAAVRDPVIAFKPDQAELDATVGSGHRRYFNSGVMMIDTAAYVDRKLLKRLIELISNRQLAYIDQSALNVALRGDWMELSPSFNMFITQWATWVRRAFPPAVVHFAGPRKAWLGAEYVYNHPAAVEMARFFAGSPWPRFPTQFEDAKKKLTRMVIPRGAIAGDDPNYRHQAERLAYYRETSFADVEAGLTLRRSEFIPTA
jgi:lipopolysaccharide biosynthesis glycosyltransferase